MINENLFQQGIAAFDEGDYNSASLIFYRLTKHDPCNQDVWLWLAECVDDTENRRNFLTTAMRLNPKSDAGRHAAARLRYVRLPVCFRRLTFSLGWFSAIASVLEAFFHRLSAGLRYSTRH